MDYFLNEYLFNLKGVLRKLCSSVFNQTSPAKRSGVNEHIMYSLKSSKTLCKILISSDLFDVIVCL